MSSSSSSDSTGNPKRLSDLSVNVVLDHARGHDSATCHRELLQRITHHNHNVIVEPNSRSFPEMEQSQASRAMEKILLKFTHQEAQQKELP